MLCQMLVIQIHHIYYIPYSHKFYNSVRGTQVFFGSLYSLETSAAKKLFYYAVD